MFISNIPQDPKQPYLVALPYKKEQGMRPSTFQYSKNEFYSQTIKKEFIIIQDFRIRIQYQMLEQLEFMHIICIQNFIVSNTILFDKGLV